jgi:hypothetical protein
MNEPQPEALATREQPKAPILVTERGVQLTTLEDMFRFSRAVCASNLAPKSFQTPEQVMLAIQTGAELGFSPMQALQNIAVINGKVSVYGPATLAICMNQPGFEDIDEFFLVDGARADEEEVTPAITANKEVCAVSVIKPRNREPVRRTFSVSDAKVAGLWKKAGPWSQYPKDMLRYKARHRAENDAFPNALKGLPLAQDLMAGEYAEKPAKAREVASGLDIGGPAQEPFIPGPEAAKESAAQAFTLDAETK